MNTDNMLKGWHIRKEQFPKVLIEPTNIESTLKFLIISKINMRSSLCKLHSEAIQACVKLTERYTLINGT
jgi:hypothetical protein